jgi:hypothetical protein
MKRIALFLLASLLVSFGSGCCCCKGLFGSSYATAPACVPGPAPVYSAPPPTYYTPTTVAPTTVQAPICPPQVVTQPCCPCTCPQ